MRFKFFNPEKKVMVHRHRLPHWEQDEATYFITFRTADSLPREVVELWLKRKNKWLRRHQVDPNAANWQQQLRENDPKLEDEFHQKFSAEFHRFLDAGYGECVFRNPEIAKIVADNLLHFDGQRYFLGDFVVMPNHIHLLVQMFEGVSLEKQCYSWKHFTAVEINRCLGRSGTFWQTEGHDRLVRDQEEFEHYRNYIEQNPIRANLKDGEYFYYRRLAG
jgi:REP element-mobilizing transposase RayT